MNYTNGNIRFGRVSEVFASEGRARVDFQQDDIVSKKLPIASQSVGSTKILFLPNVNDFVACLMDENIEDGVILGGLYTNSNTPEFGNDQGFKFPDGSEILFKDENKIVVKSSTQLQLTGNQKVLIENQAESLGGVISELIDAIAAITHNVTAVGAPTGPPINLDTFTALKARINNFLD